jgi:RNA polymerase sigma factor (sigma-70 family)
MGPDWLKDRFNLDWNDIRNIVINACERSGWQHADDVCGEVMFRLHRQYRNDPTCFENSQHLLGTARRDARFCLLHTFRKMRRLEFHDPRELPESLARARASEDDIDAREDRERLLALLADCQQTLSLLATASPLIREVFRLHCEGVSGKEIAQKLGTSGSTVARRLHDAFDLLRQTLSEN